MIEREKECLASGGDALSDNPMVTVIMPVYNTQDYLEESVRSVLDQDYANLELICIDDGSTDSCPEILERISQEDQRVRVLRQENAGQGTARNRALEVARGTYVYCLDSDDLVVKGSLGRIVAMMEAEELDYLGFDGEVFSDDPSIEFDANAYMRSSECEQVRSGRELFWPLQESGDLSLSPCIFMAKRSMLDARGVRFVEDRVHEDDLYSFMALLGAERARTVHETVLLRRYRANSTMTSNNWRASARGHFRNAALLQGLMDESRYADLMRELELCRYIEARLCILAFVKEGGSLKRLPSVVHPQNALEQKTYELMARDLWFGRLGMCYRKAKLRKALGKG